MAYQLLWIIKSLNPPCRRTVIEICNPLLGVERIHTYPKYISRAKMNGIAQLGFELAYCDITVQHITDYVTGIHSQLIWYFGSISLFKWYINFRWLNNVKNFFIKETVVELFKQSLEYERIHTFPDGIIRKVNFITQLEFELNDYDVAVQDGNYYVTRTHQTI